MVSSGKEKNMTKEEQVEVIKFKIKHEIEYLEELVERKKQAKKDYEECLPEDYSSKLAEFKTALSHISRQYARLSAFIEMGCMLDLISSVEFAELSDEISELAFS